MIKTAKNRLSTLSAEEVRKFAQASSEWWDPNGQFSMLHRMNPVRLSYIRNSIEQLTLPSIVDTEDAQRYPLKGLRVLDIGCGGGILSESLARLGANVLGADAAQENIQMAQFHQSLDPQLNATKLPGSLTYRHTLIEQLKEEPNLEQFDVVCGLEVIEHVENRQHFLKCCSDLTKQNGLLFFSTMNKTWLSSLLTIHMAENVLQWVPKGTHDYEKYVEPNVFRNELNRVGCQVLDMCGMVYVPLMNDWRLYKNALQANYILMAQKR